MDKNISTQTYGNITWTQFSKFLYLFYGKDFFADSKIDFDADEIEVSIDNADIIFGAPEKFMENIIEKYVSDFSHKSFLYFMNEFPSFIYAGVSLYCPMSAMQKTFISSAIRLYGMMIKNSIETEKMRETFSDVKSEKYSTILKNTRKKFQLGESALSQKLDEKNCKWKDLLSVLDELLTLELDDKERQKISNKLLCKYLWNNLSTAFEKILFIEKEYFEDSIFMSSKNTSTQIDIPDDFISQIKTFKDCWIIMKTMTFSYVDSKDKILDEKDDFFEATDSLTSVLYDTLQTATKQKCADPMNKLLQFHSGTSYPLWYWVQARLNIFQINFDHSDSEKKLIADTMSKFDKSFADGKYYLGEFLPMLLNDAIVANLYFADGETEIEKATEYFKFGVAAKIFSHDEKDFYFDVHNFGDNFWNTFRVTKFVNSDAAKSKYMEEAEKYSDNTKESVAEKNNYTQADDFGALPLHYALFEYKMSRYGMDKEARRELAEIARDYKENLKALPNFLSEENLSVSFLDEDEDFEQDIVGLWERYYERFISEMKEFSEDVYDKLNNDAYKKMLKKEQETLKKNIIALIEKYSKDELTKEAYSVGFEKYVSIMQLAIDSYDDEIVSVLLEKLKTEGVDLEKYCISEEENSMIGYALNKTDFISDFQENMQDGTSKYLYEMLDGTYVPPRYEPPELTKNKIVEILHNYADDISEGNVTVNEVVMSTPIYSVGLGGAESGIVAVIEKLMEYKKGKIEFADLTNIVGSRNSCEIQLKIAKAFLRHGAIVEKENTFLPATVFEGRAKNSFLCTCILMRNFAMLKMALSEFPDVFKPSINDKFITLFAMSTPLDFYIQSRMEDVYDLDEDDADSNEPFTDENWAPETNEMLSLFKKAGASFDIENENGETARMLVEDLQHLGAKMP